MIVHHRNDIEAQMMMMMMMNIGGEENHDQDHFLWIDDINIQAVTKVDIIQNILVKNQDLDPNLMIIIVHHIIIIIIEVPSKLNEIIIVHHHKNLHHCHRDQDQDPNHDHDLDDIIIDDENFCFFFVKKIILSIVIHENKYFINSFF